MEWLLTTLAEDTLDKVVTTITASYSTYSPTKNDLSKATTRMIETNTH